MFAFCICDGVDGIDKSYLGLKVEQWLCICTAFIPSGPLKQLFLRSNLNLEYAHHDH